MAITLETKQKRIVETLEGPLFVAAGAGSGKTFTLTQRIMYALRPGSKPCEQWADPQVPEAFLDSIDQVLAITFTEKAAEELKERIRKALLEEGLAAEAEKVDSAWISTIHGMCARIIRARAFDLGVDPAFAVIGYEDDLRRLAIEHVLRRETALDAQGSGAFDALLQAFSVEGAGGSQDLGSLTAILAAILGKVSSSVGGLEAFVQVSARPSHIDLYEAYREIAEAPSYANAEAARTALDALDAYLASPRDLTALRTCFQACGKLNKNARGKGKDEPAAVDAVRAARTPFFADAYLAARHDALDQLIPLAREVQREYEALKRDRAVLDNDDLLTRAYDALKNNPLVRQEFSGKFKMVMVDEFQDTAQQQVELVRLLCSPDSRELCTVGDAQQSIYRFRGADVSVFRTKRDEVTDGGTVCSLDINYRSHADILRLADRIFEGGTSNPLGRDFLHLESCGEDKRKGARALRSPETSRCQAVLVTGGNADARTEQKAAAIAAHFKRLQEEEGFRPGDMVILMTKLSRADAYVRAVRAAGMPCVVSGGTSVFRRAPEVAVIRALLCFLANPDDGENGLTPLLASPMFGLGAQELLALATHRDLEAGIVDSRTLTGDVLLSGAIMEEFGPLPLLDRARTVLSRALSRVGRDPVASIVRDALNESGWLYRLQGGGAQERAEAANILKALAIIEAEQIGRELFPRLVARAFADHIDHEKESPATLNGADADAVRIMTVHASKGLEFPVVAVAECDGIRSSKDRFVLCDRAGRTPWAAFPNKHERAEDEDILQVPELDEDQLASPEPPASAAPAYAYMRREKARLDYEEAARLLYVAITRAREVVVLALAVGPATELLPGHATSLVGEVLSRILPADSGAADLPDLSADRLDLPGAHAGDFQLVALDDLKLPNSKKPLRVYEAEAYPGIAGCGSTGDDAACNAGGETEPGARSFPLVFPAEVVYSVTPVPRQPRDVYSYTSVAAELHEAGEDRVPVPTANAADGDEEEISPTASSMPASADTDGDPTALGSAFHAAAQWMVETGSDVVPPARLDALCRTWGCSPAQRDRLEAALTRWQTSDVRAGALAWPCVRAEVPFFALASAELVDHGAYAEGAIDLLCTDPADPSHALVVDYKTGGSRDETPAQLTAKHELQARIYADALHKAGYAQVTCRFVRVEQPDPVDSTQPQVVSYEL